MPLQKPIIAFSLLGEITSNSRALRQIDALSQHFRVVAIGFSKSKEMRTSTNFGKLIQLSHPAGRGSKFFVTAHALLNRELKGIDASLYHASDLYSLMASRAAARRRNTPLTYDARELYSELDSIRDHPIKSAIWKRIESVAIKDCHQVFTVSQSISGYIANLYNITPPTVVYNAPDLSSQKASLIDFNKLVSESNRPIFLHNGQIRRGRGCINLVNAFVQTSKSTLAFMGSGPLKSSIMQISRREKIENRILFVDPVPPDHVISATSTASIGVTLLEDTCLNHKLALPNKLFEYSAAGIPTLGSNLPEISKMINTHGIGTTVDPNNVLELGQKLVELENNADQLDDWRAKTSAFTETFSWNRASQAFLEPFLRLVNLGA